MNSVLHRLSSVVGLLLAALCFTSCASAPGNSTLGPIIVQVAQAHIVDAILNKDPGAEAKLLLVADALDAIKDSASVNEITEVAIRHFVESRADKWGLLPIDQQLLISGLLLARDRYISTTGVGVILTNDPRVGVWIAAIKDGIRTGIAAHHAR